jgi:ATP-dependent helicase/nuclease subunit B
MTCPQLLLPPSADFWPALVRLLTEEEGFLTRHAHPERSDFSAVRIIVPGFTQARQLRHALMMHITGAFIPPRITTLSAWLEMLPPDPLMPAMPAAASGASASERMMSLYAELRQHAWLKKLVTAKRNTDLLPLAQTLSCLFDELSRALLPAIDADSDALDARWQAALEQLPAPARTLLSDESQLVWTLWKHQLATGDATAACFARMIRLAKQARCPLIWIGACEPDPLDRAFLDACATRVPVLQAGLDWRASAIAPVFAASWPEMLENRRDDASETSATGAFPGPGRDGLTHVFLSPAGSLEQEALNGAQTVIDWLQEGCESIAVVAQDRAVARRIRALLERAEVFVADETGWKLSTTRAAAAVASLLDVAATHADAPVLLDLLKTSCLFADMPDKETRVMAIEQALRRLNVQGGWEAIGRAVRNDAPAADLIALIADQVRMFTGRATLSEWGRRTCRALDALGMAKALSDDAAGAQVIELLQRVTDDCGVMPQSFSLMEWRAFLGMRLEATPFMSGDADRRVQMLQLNGMQLRAFDAVLLVGADARHLPSQRDETLFFANAVRRELGLPTREQKLCTQLRDFAEMLGSSGRVVLSWQTSRDGEANALSNWVQRLQLVLETQGLPGLGQHHAALPLRTLAMALPSRPAPSAPNLLPEKLSASAYNLLVACPYQFFATRMLGLDTLAEWSDLPEKRDYGDWLHEILKEYHLALRDRKVASGEREALLRSLSEQVFARTLDRSAAALGYYARWQKTIPAYLSWAGEREAKGWTFVDGEKTLVRTLSWHGGQVTLHGCIDRIDENAAGERAILDYKTRTVAALKERMQEREDHQLAFYALLSDSPVASAHVVALEGSGGKTGDVEANELGEWRTQLERQITGIMQGIADGKPLAAMGIERVCVYCEVRGLCRKGAWQ